MDYSTSDPDTIAAELGRPVDSRPWRPTAARGRQPHRPTHMTSRGPADDEVLVRVRAAGLDWGVWLGHSVGHSATAYSTCQGDISWTAQLS
jgi:hypothetical protein